MRFSFRGSGKTLTPLKSGVPFFYLGDTQLLYTWKKRPPEGGQQEEKMELCY